MPRQKLRPVQKSAPGLKTSAVKVTPNILKGPCLQSSLKLLHYIGLDLFMDPIHIALVFSVFNFRPDIM